MIAVEKINSSTLIVVNDDLISCLAGQPAKNCPVNILMKTMDKFKQITCTCLLITESLIAKSQNAKPKMQKLSFIQHPSTKSSTLHTCLPPLRQKTGRQVKVNRGHNPTQTPNSTYTLFIVVHILISRRNTTQKLCATCLFWYTFRPPT